MSEEFPAPAGLTEDEWQIVLERRKRAIHDRGYNAGIHDACMWIESWTGDNRELAVKIREKLWRKNE